MKPLTAWRAFRHRLKGMELQQSHTAICLHWPTCIAGRFRTDVTFMLKGIHTGEALHQLVDVLLEEHSCPPADDIQDVFTEVTLFWHLPDGTWETEEYLSHMCA